jgi:hypothetical protein
MAASGGGTEPGDPLLASSARCWTVAGISGAHMTRPGATGFFPVIADIADPLRSAHVEQGNATQAAGPAPSRLNFRKMLQGNKKNAGVTTPGWLRCPARLP